MRESKGDIVAVSDAEIMEAMNKTARLTAVFGEPSGAASVAGVKRAVADGIIKKNESVCAVITGNGLKDIKAAIERQETPASPSARVLVDRLKEAIDRFTGGDPELRNAMRIVMADQVNWPSAPIGAKFREFFNEAIAA